MRDNQFSFVIDRFGSEAFDGVSDSIKGHIDGNNIFEVVSDFIDYVHKMYAPQMPADEFMVRLLDSGKERDQGFENGVARSPEFGSCTVKQAQAVC